MEIVCNHCGNTAQIKRRSLGGDQPWFGMDLPYKWSIVNGIRGNTFIFLCPLHTKMRKTAREAETIKSRKNPLRKLELED